MNALLLFFALVVTTCAGQLIQPFPDPNANNATASNSTQGQAPSGDLGSPQPLPPNYGGWSQVWHHNHAPGQWGPPVPPYNNFLPGANSGFNPSFPSGFNPAFWYPGFAPGFNPGFNPRPFPGFPGFGR